MRAVIQRVESCHVAIEGERFSSISEGILVLLGVARGDTEKEAGYIAEKIANLRIFPDDEGKMNRSVLETGGAVMAVSQFTLLGDCRKGRRPSYAGAEDPDVARGLCERFVENLSAMGIEVQTGVFGAMMSVELINDGPVTLVIDV